MKIQKRDVCRKKDKCVLRRSPIVTDDALGVSIRVDGVQRYGKTNSLEVDEVLFYLLDGLMDQDEGITRAITGSLLKFAQAQPEFTLKSILSFLEVQKTSISHQYSLLLVMRRCISQCKSVLPNAAIKEILLFMLRELNFIKTSDTRHMEMREIVNATSVLCPGFSVDVILAFIQDMRSNEKCTDIMCIYIQILTHLCALVPKNSYVCKILVSSCIMPMYSDEIFKENNDELCKDLCTFLYTLSNMLGIQYKITLEDVEKNGKESSYQGLNVENCGYRRFLCYNEIFKVFEMGKSAVEKLSNSFGIENAIDDEHVIKKSVSCRMDGDELKVRSGRKSISSADDCEDPLIKQYTSFISIYSEEIEECGNRTPERYVSIDCPEPINAIEPIFPLMVESYLPTIYTIASYNVTCMEVFYSLVIFSQHITDDTLDKYGASLLDAMIVRFHNYLPNLNYRQVCIPGYEKKWIKLYKSASTTVGSKIVTLISSIGYSMDKYAILPPTYFVKSLKLYIQILEKRSPHILYVQIFNVCGVLFGLLHNLFECGSEYFIETGAERLSTSDAFSSVNKSFLNTSDKKECKVFMHNIKETYGILFSNQSMSLILLEFLFKKMKSESKSEVTVALYIFCILYSSFLPSGVGDACSKVWRLINELDELLKRFKCDAISSRLILLLISHLSRGNWLTFHSIGTLNMTSRISRILAVHDNTSTLHIGVSRPVYHLINYAFNLKVNYDVEKRISGSKGDDADFLRIVYEGTQKITDEHLHVAVDTCFDSLLPRYSSEVLLAYLVKMLVKNKKRNVLTIFRSVLGILNQNDPRRIYLILSTEWLLKLMTYALVYMHDPVCYADEAFAGAKIANVVANLLINKRYYYTSMASYYGSIHSPYSSMGITYGRIGSNYDGISPAHQISDFGSPFSDELSIDPSFDIAENFTIMSQFLSRILDENRPSSAQHAKVIIKTLGPIVVSIKKRSIIQSSYNSFYKSDHTPSPLHTAYHMVGILNILSVCAKMSIRLTSDLINLLTGLPKQSLSVVLEHSLQFCENYEIYRLLSDIYEWSHLLNFGEDLLFTMGKLRSLSVQRMEDVQTIKQQIQALRGQCIGVLGASTRNRKHVLLKVYYILLMNVPKGGSSFTLFGKSAAILLSEKIRCICISALAHLYIYGFTLTPRDGAMRNIMEKELKRSMDVMSAQELQNKVTILYKEVFLKHFGESEESRVGKETLSSNMNLECIIAPLIFFLNTEGEFCLIFLRAILGILSKESLGSQPDGSLNYFILCTGRLLYFLSNPALKEYNAKVEYDVSSIEGYYRAIFNNQGSMDDTFLEHKFLHNIHGKASDVSFLAFSILCALSRHHSGFEDSLYPFSTLYCLLSYADWYVASKSLSLEEYPLTNLSRLLLYYMLNIMYTTQESVYRATSFPNIDVTDGETSWARLSKVLLVTLFVSPKMGEQNTRHRIIITLNLLQRIKYVPTTLEKMYEDERVGWINVVLLLWAHILRLGSENLLKMQLMRCLENILNVESLEYIKLESPRLHVLENCNVVNGIGKIDQLLPVSCLIPCMLECINFLESWSLLSDSFAKIIHKILQHRYDEIDSKHLESVLITIFKRFSHFFQSENVPTFLRLFLIDLARADFFVLCNALFSKQQPCTRQFQLSIIRIISSDLYLLESILQFLTTVLLPSSSTTTNCPIEFVMDFTLKILLERFAHFIMTKNGATFISAFIIYVNSLEQPFQDALSILERILFLLNSHECSSARLSQRSDGSEHGRSANRMSIANASDRSEAEGVMNDGRKTGMGGRPEGAQRASMDGSSTTTKGPSKLSIGEKVVYSKDAKKSKVKPEGNKKGREWVLVENVGKRIVAKSTRIIGYNNILKVAFLDILLFIINERTFNTNIVAILTIFSELLRYGYLINRDECVKSVLEQVPIIDTVQHLYFKSIHYYLKHERRLSVKRSKKDREDILAILSGAIGKFGTDYYLTRALCSAILLSLRGNMRVSELVHKVLILKPVPVEQDTRYAYLQVHIAIIRWYKRRKVIPLYVKRHMMHPLAIALASIGSERLSCASTTYLTLARDVLTDFSPYTTCSSTNLFTKSLSTSLSSINHSVNLHSVKPRTTIFSSSFSPSPLCSESLVAFLESIIVKRGGICFCGCGESQDGEGRVCLSTSFYLLNFFSHALPFKGDKVEIPEEIQEEFRMIKRNELNRRSSIVLFGDSCTTDARMDWPMGTRKDSEFYDIDKMYSLRLPKEGYGSPIQHLYKNTTSMNMYKECPSDLLKILYITDYSLKDGSLSRINIPFKNDNMDITNIMIANNAAFFDICNIEPILKSILFTSPRLYRFCLVQKYLVTPAGFSAFQASETFAECIELCASIISICSMYLDKEMEELKMKMKNNWPNCFLEILRFNAIVHFEALATVVIKKFYNILEGDYTKHKKKVFKAMQLFANIT